MLLGEGSGRRNELPDLAETVGGAEHGLIEQEDSSFSLMETAKRCLENFKAIPRGERLTARGNRARGWSAGAGGRRRPRDWS